MRLEFSSMHKLLLTRVIVVNFYGYILAGGECRVCVVWVALAWLVVFCHAWALVQLEVLLLFLLLLLLQLSSQLLFSQLFTTTITPTRQLTQLIQLTLGILKTLLCINGTSWFADKESHLMRLLLCGCCAFLLCLVVISIVVVLVVS